MTARAGIWVAHQAGSRQPREPPVKAHHVFERVETTGVKAWSRMPKITKARGLEAGQRFVQQSMSRARRLRGSLAEHAIKTVLRIRDVGIREDVPNAQVCLARVGRRRDGQEGSACLRMATSGREKGTEVRSPST